MTRINTNVSSLNAQKTLARSNASLQQALTRLSTGLRINYGKDDPAGLIASDMLRSDIISVQRAISNSQRANQIIATADSALGQVTSLLNDIRGLVTEAANEGALTDEQIAANQLQVDSSLEAINRIAQTTSFQGRRVLDGSLDFLTTAGTVATVEDIEITRASIGSTGQVSVDVDIATKAAKAEITDNGFTTATKANDTLTFAAGALLNTTTNSAEIEFVSKTLGTTYSGVDFTIASGDLGGAAAASASFNGADTVTITIDTVGGATAALVAAAVAAESTTKDIFLASVITEAALVAADASDSVTTGIADLKIEADTTGAAYNNIAISIATAAGTPVGTPTAAYDATLNTITITVNDTGRTTLAKIETAVEAITNASFTATVTTAGQERLDIFGAGVDVSETGNTGVSGGALLNDEIVLQIAGNKGVEVFSFESGAGANAVVAAINLVSDATGVSATVAGNTITLNSTDYGSNAYIAVEVISEGSSGTFKDQLSAVRDAGEDIIATVNGINANGNGNALSINTTTLAMSILVTAASDTNFDFNITGGGALFQLGPDVVSNQQVRLGIQSVNTAKLRGASGRLFSLADGQSAALNTDATTASKIVDEVLTKVTSLRGRLGAFQKTMLDININSLNDTLESLTDAESSIRDADFAAESAALTRAQILVQSGTSVLAIANSNPQNVLALLR